MFMKEFNSYQIAAVLSGHPGTAWPELRLIMLFQAEAGDRVAVEPVAMREPLLKAA
jgi:hypothetical protein